MRTTYSKYIETRRFARKVYNKIAEAIEPILKEYNLTAEFCMSAKTQTSSLAVMASNGNPKSIPQKALEGIEDAINEYYDVSDTDDCTNCVLVEFRD